MAVAQTKGIQSQGALACPKHFAAYNQDTNRFGLDPEWKTVDIHVQERVLHELYLPAFRAAVQEGDAASVMCSYNMLNGYFTCENDWLLNKTLRQGWGFEGFVVADWYFSTRSTVGAVIAGLDISMPFPRLVLLTPQWIQRGVESGASISNAVSKDTTLGYEAHP